MTKRAWSLIQQLAPHSSCSWKVGALFVVTLLVGGWLGVGWIFALIAGFLLGSMLPNSRAAFAFPFVLAFMTWASIALLQDIGAGFRLSSRISQVFSIPIPIAAYLITGLVGGLTAGAAGSLSHRLRQLAVGQRAAGK